MVRTSRSLAVVVLAVASLILFDAAPAKADMVVYSPGVSYYYSPPVTGYYVPRASYYYAPATSYYYSPVVSYYPAPVSYYTPPPVVSYYAPSPVYYAAPAAVTTTRYGLFGRPRYSTTYYRPAYYYAP